MQASTCPYSTESVISFVASEYGCSKESVDTNYQRLRDWKRRRRSVIEDKRKGKAQKADIRRNAKRHIPAAS